jgi:hypothetical protein
MEASQLLPHHHQQNYRLLVFVLAVKILGDAGKHKPLFVLLLLLVMFVREVFFLVLRIIPTFLIMKKKKKKKKMSSKWVPFVFCNTTIAITGAS